MANERLEIPACAAIRHDVSGVLIAGRRHDVCIQSCIGLGLHKRDWTQGFMTTAGRFVTREEAMHLAKAADMRSCWREDGELHGEILFSEDMY